jgi:ferredoxin-NADP reductase
LFEICRHPFSISTSPYSDEGEFTLHVRALGDWTHALKKLCEKKKICTILYEGPYGEPQIDFEGSKYKMFLLISGGIGITPMQSICNQIADEHARGRPVELCYFVWSCRDKFMVDSVTPEQLEKATKNGLPLSFQPDIMGNIGLNSGASDASFSITARRLDDFTSDGSSVSASKDAASTRDSETMKGYGMGNFHTEFYLTQAKHEDELSHIKSKSRKNLRLGRPNIEHIFATMKAVAKEKGISNVAVLACGPAALVSSVVLQAELNTSYAPGGVRFDTHVETFAF